MLFSPLNLVTTIALSSSMYSIHCERRVNETVVVPHICRPGRIYSYKNTKRLRCLSSRESIYIYISQRNSRHYQSSSEHTRDRPNRTRRRDTMRQRTNDVSRNRCRSSDECATKELVPIPTQAELNKSSSTLALAPALATCSYGCVHRREGARFVEWHEKD